MWLITTYFHFTCLFHASILIDDIFDMMCVIHVKILTTSFKLMSFELSSEPISIQGKSFIHLLLSSLHLIKQLTLKIFGYKEGCERLV